MILRNNISNVFLMKLNNFILNFLNKYKLEIKFIIVGIWNTFFGYLLFFFLDIIFEKNFDSRQIAYMSAIFLGQIISIISAFFLHKYLTFNSYKKGKEAFIEFIKFCMTYAFVFILNLIFLPLIVEFLNINPRIAALIIIIFSSIISFYGHLKFSFKKK